MTRRLLRPDGAHWPGDKEWSAYLRRLVIEAFAGFAVEGQMKNEKLKIKNGKWKNKRMGE